MRVFLILLLIANLGYFGWRQFVAAPAAGAPDQETQFRQAEQALTLMAELSPERRQLMGTLAEARAARTQAAEQLEQVEQEFDAVAGEVEDSAADLAQDQARSAEVQQALLETLDATVSPEVPAPDPVQPWCANTNPLSDQSAALAFAQGVREFGAEAVVETREEAVSSTWWVYLPAFASEAEARAMLAELQGKGIDSYYMRNGDMAGGISLGVYSREESAGIAQRQLAEQGYMPSIREVARMEERPFVRVVLPDGGVRDSAEWSAFVAAARPVELTEFTCEPIASENEFP